MGTWWPVPYLGGAEIARGVMAMNPTKKADALAVIGVLG
jgi:hypothetical protein